MASIEIITRRISRAPDEGDEGSYSLDISRERGQLQIAYEGDGMGVSFPEEAIDDLIAVLYEFKEDNK